MAYVELSHGAWKGPNGPLHAVRLTQARRCLSRNVTQTAGAVRVKGCQKYHGSEKENLNAQEIAFVISQSGSVVSSRTERCVSSRSEFVLQSYQLRARVCKLRIRSHDATLQLQQVQLW